MEKYHNNILELKNKNGEVVGKKSRFLIIISSLIVILLVIGLFELFSYSDFINGVYSYSDFINGLIYIIITIIPLIIIFSKNKIIYRISYILLLLLLLSLILFVVFLSFAF